jgi:hypothetical protein
MIDVMQCPSCKESDPQIFSAAVTLSPCPHCGLSGEAGMDIRAMEVSSGGPGLKAQAIVQRIQLDQAERDLEQCKAILLLVRKHLDSFQPVVPAS